VMTLWGLLQISLQDRLPRPNGECLDGHPFVDKDGQSYLIYSHEWQQCENGEIIIQRMPDDWSRLEGEAKLLFRAADVPWTERINAYSKSGFVTDGPCMLLHDGVYYLMWSSIGKDGYCVGCATANSVEGPYRHYPQPLLNMDGGHNCCFRGLNGEMYTSFHMPNSSPYERLMIKKL